MTPQRRRLLLFLGMDALVVTGLLLWWFNRQAPAAATVHPPVPVPTVAEVPRTILPDSPAGQVECHGLWHGQPFWLRLLPADPALNGNRRLHLVYTPPAQAEVDGAGIHDAPLLILDRHLRLVQWDNRDGATGVIASDPGYRVTRELHAPSGDQSTLKSRKLTQPAAWDLRLAPLFALLAWKPDATWSVPLVDFWGPRAGERLQATGRDTEVILADARFTVQVGVDGRAASLIDAQARPVLTITAWVTPIAADARP